MMIPRILVAAWALAGALPAQAQGDGGASDAATLEACARLENPTARLACYDHLADRASKAAARGPAPPGDAASAPERSATASTAFQNLHAPGWMTRDWELDEAHKRGTFRFRMYQPNFLLPLHYSTSTNSNPRSPTPGRDGSLPEYRNLETKLQISLRTKLAEKLLLPDADLWFGYTQVSLWQLWSSSLSAPFRSTDYEPELIYVVPVPERYRNLPGSWTFRFGQLGLAHQSNGQTEPLSRSWNRVYLAAGLERGAVGLVARVWRRIPEDAADDDNPDLTSFRGRGEVSVTWDGELARAGLNWRTNFENLSRGSLELNWTYPVGGSRDDGLRWYVQAFSGYGESLLDYNFRQTSFGLGVTLFNF